MPRIVRDGSPCKRPLPDLGSASPTLVIGWSKKQKGFIDIIGLKPSTYVVAGQDVSLRPSGYESEKY